MADSLFSALRMDVMTSKYDQHLPRNPANFAPLSPLGFIQRTAEVYPERLAIVHGSLRQTWARRTPAAASWPVPCSAPASARTTPWPSCCPTPRPWSRPTLACPWPGAVLNAPEHPAGP